MLNNDLYKEIKEIDTEEMARKIYNYIQDMDFMDYEEEKEQEIGQIENGLYYLKTIALNEYNKDYFRILILALKNLIEKL